MKEFDLNPNSPWGRSVTAAEFVEMCRTGRLQGEPLERYWRMNEFQEEVPPYLDIMVRKSDIEKLVNDAVREGILPKKKRRWKR